MNKAAKSNKSKPAKVIIVIIAFIVATIVIHELCAAFLDRRPWVFGGTGTPDIIRLNDKYRLEKVIALRNGYYVKDIRGGSMIYGRAEKNNSGEVNGAADLNGNVLTELGAYNKDMWLALNEIGKVYETPKPYNVSDKADKPTMTVDTSDGGQALRFDKGELAAVWFNGSLGVIGDNGELFTMFDDDKGRSWRLERPLFFGDYLAVRIYYCDCVYRVVRQ